LLLKSPSALGLAYLLLAGEFARENSFERIGENIKKELGHAFPSNSILIYTYRHIHMYIHVSTIL